MRTIERDIVEAVRSRARPILGRESDYDPLIERIGERRVVLLGEATHGTHEFYRERARITRRLVEEKGFSAVAVEADWPDAYRVNRYVRSMSDDVDAGEALGSFERFPRWMWRNAEVVELLEWLRSHNETRERGTPSVGFYGIDLYSLHASIDAVIHYLDEVDPEAARRARQRYACFDHFGEDAQAYGYAAGLGLAPDCEETALQQLVELRRRAGELSARDGRIPEDEFFFAEQNARLVTNAEEYYRSMFRNRVSSWNLRDRHMTDTVRALLEHFDRPGRPSKIVVWAHNSHLGDARATEMGRRGEWNVGQLAREEFGDDAFLVGFTTASGTVAAARDWDAPVEIRAMRPPLRDSWEHLLHEVGIPAYLVLLDPGVSALAAEKLERAIGVIYRPETERVSHYFEAALADQFDALLHFDRTRAVTPLDRLPGWPHEDAPETYPFET